MKLLAFFLVLTTILAPIINAETFTLLTPKDNETIFKDYIVIKGHTHPHGSVFVNGEEIFVKENGRFYLKHPITELGKNKVYVSYIDPENTANTIKRSIQRVQLPKGVDSVDPSLYHYIVLANLNLFPSSSYQENPEEAISRKEAAVVFSKLSQLSTQNVQITLPLSDVDTANYAAPHIYSMVNNGVLTYYPNRSFQPDAPLSKMQYILAINKLYRPKRSNTRSSLKQFSDYTSDWTETILKSTLDNQWLPKSDTLDLSKEISRKELANLLAKTNPIQEKINIFETTYTDNTPKLAHVTMQLEEYKTEQNKINSGKNTLSLRSPGHNSITYKAAIRIKGKTAPFDRVEIASFNIIANKKGLFSFDYPLEDGKNQLKITANDQTLHRTIFYLESYKDLKFHWINETAAKLRHLGILKKVEKFSPKATVTREELAEDLFRYFDFTDYVTGNVTPNIEGAVALKLLSQNNIPTPSQDPLTRAEALRIVVAACDIISTANNSIPPLKQRISDISKSHWAHPILAKAVYYQLLSPPRKFNPNQAISKAELVALLAKTPQVRARLKKEFEDDVKK